MKPSNRLLTINGEPGKDDGWSVHYDGRRRKDAGEPITLLTVGDHDSETPDHVLDTMDASVRGGDTRYAPVNGKLPLREAIAARTRTRTGVPTTADNVFVATGGQGALFAGMMAATEPHDTITIIDPYYATYPATVRATTCKLNILRADPDAAFQLDRDTLLKATEGSRALLINTPNNPTGAIYTDETLAAIREACLTHDLALFSDEVYDSQTHGRPHVSPRQLPDMADRTFVIGSLSKSHVMTGFRIGWLIGPAQMIAPVTDLSNATTYGVAGFIQTAALDALQNGDATEQDTAALYTRRRNRAIATLEGHNTIRISPPNGAMYVMLDIRATGLSGLAFAEKLLADQGIATMPGESFGAAAAGHIRVALTVPDDELAAALTRIGTFATNLANSA